MKLKELVKIRTGKLDANASDENGDYPFFTCSKNPLRINNYSYDCECVLVAGNGDLNVKYYNGKFDAYQRTYIIETIDSSKLNTRFLFHFMSLYVNELKNQSIGSAIKFIKLGNLQNANIPLYPLEKQLKINSELDNYIKIIETKQEELNLLNNLIKSRFIEMFETIDLSSERQRWLPIKDVTKIITGTTPSTNDETNWNGDILWITPAEMNANTFYVFDTESKLTEKGRKSKSLEIMPVNTVLLSTRAPIGKVGIVGKPMACNQGFKNFICNEKLNPVFLYILLKNNTEYLNSLGSGTTFLEVSKAKIGELKIPLPPIELQNEFAKYVEQIDKSKFIVQQQIKDLQELLDKKMDEYFGE